MQPNGKFDFFLYLRRYSTGKLQLLQTLEILGPIVQCRFAHFASNELILMVQMVDGSFIFYKYYGIVDFRMLHTFKLNDIGKKHSAYPSFSLTEDRQGFLQLLAINTGLEIGILECIFH